MISEEILDMNKREGKVFDIILSLSIAVLFVLVSYNRFLLYHDRYAALFRLAWNPSLYPGDLIRDHLFTKCSIFYALLSYLAPVVRHIGEENALFIIYVVNNSLVLFGCYITAMVYGSRKLAMFFIVLLFTNWDLLPGASISVIYAHHLSQTAFAVMPALLAIYFFIKKRFLAFFISLFVTALFHMRTGFAVGVPLAFCSLWDIVKSPEDRKQLLFNFVLITPLWAFIIYIYLKAASSGLMGCADLIKATAENERGETDILTIEIDKFGFNIFNYIFINILSIYAFFRYRVTNVIDKRIFGLILSGNAGVFLGVLTSFVYRYLIPVPFLLFLWWPKIAIVSTYLCLLFISRHLIFNRRFWQNLHPLSVGFILFFMTGSLLNVNMLTTKLMPKALIVILFLYCVIYFSKRLRRENVNKAFATIFIFFIVLSSVYIQLRYFQKNLNDRKKYGWNATIYRPPFLFDVHAQDYDAITWLNRNADLNDMVIFPVVEEKGIKFESYRGYSQLPVFYSWRLEDVYGSAKKYNEWKLRKEILQKWLNSKKIYILANANIKYVVIKKKDEEFFKIPSHFRVYSNQEVEIYKIIQ